MIVSILRRARRVGAFVLTSALCTLLLMPAPAFALNGPALSEAQAAVVMDQAGNVLWELNSTAELPMASITKVMTVMVALDSGMDLDTPCSITEADLYWNSQEIGYKSTDTPSLLELIKSSLVYSGNDAAYNIALNVSGSEEVFVELMNAKAAELGMTHTHFANAHGLEAEGHYSCAADLAIMGRYAMEHYPLIAEIVCQPSTEATVDGQVETFETTDDLMAVYEGLLGIKTGAVEAGTAFLGASHRGNVSLYTAVLGCETSEGRFNDTATLMDWAYETFDATSIIPGGLILRVSPYALGFNAKCVVTSPGVRVAIWPEGTLVGYGSTAPADLLTEPKDAYGTLWWRQSGRLSGGGIVYADEQLGNLPSINALALPVFTGGETTEA